MRSSSPRSAFQTWSCDAILPREDAEVGQPTDERVGGGLEDLGQQRAVGVGRDLDFLALAVGRLDRPLLVGGGQVADDRVQHAVDADLVGRRCDEHRRQDGVAHAAVEAGVQLLVGDLLALEVLGQDVVVGLGRRLQQLVAAAGDLVGELGRDLDLGALALLPDVRLAMDEVDVAAERVGPADRQVERRDLVAERCPQRVERGDRVGVLALAAGDDEERRRAGGATQRDSPLGARLDAARRVHREQRPVGGRESLDDLAREVGVAGRVDEGDLVVVVVGRRERQRQRLLALLLLRLEVERRRPVIDLAQSVDGAGGMQQVLGERRLARAGMAGEHDVAKVGHLFRHRGSI